jgi:hypothetical protein
MRQAWQTLPDPKVITVAMWLARATDIPADEQARIDWLFGWWRKLDDWVGARPGDLGQRGAVGG